MFCHKNLNFLKETDPKYARFSPKDQNNSNNNVGSKFNNIMRYYFGAITDTLFRRNQKCTLNKVK